MGQVPSTPTTEQAAELSATLEASLDRAAAAIARADVMLLATGAGWSADSGLAVYKDIANIKAYLDRELTYHDLCEPHWLSDEPGLFHGFWGSCFNDYREARPHNGYQIVQQWRDQHFGQSNPASDDLRQAQGGGKAGAFFCHTSNVDAHSFATFAQEEVRECHGNSETWQCAAGMDCPGAKGDGVVPEGERRWKAPAGFRFRVDNATMQAPAGAPAARAQVTGAGLAGGGGDGSTEADWQAQGFTKNWPVCKHCGGPARPAILMFSDSKWVDDMAQQEQWSAWRSAVIELATKRVADGSEPLRVVLLEVGAGGNVTTIRNLGEALLEELVECGGQPTLIRVNPDLPLADRCRNQPYTISLQSYGLAAIQQIDSRLTALLQTERWEQAEAAIATPLTLKTVPIDEEDGQPSSGVQKRRVAPKKADRQAAAAAAVPSPPSDDELAEMRQAFDRVDTDKNGRLDRSEVKAAGQRLGRFFTETDLDEGMAAMDKDGDGTVNFEEFTDWWWREGKLSALEKIDLKWTEFQNRFNAVTSAALGSMR